MDGEKSVVQDEKVLKAKSGYAMLLLGIIGMLLGVAVIIAGCMVFGQTGETNTALLAGSIILGVLLIVGFILELCGLRVLNPNEAYVFALFGKYYGTIKTAGFFWVNPFCEAINPSVRPAAPVVTSSGLANPAALSGKAKKVSLKTLTLNNEKQKVNDELGNPVEIGAVVIWKVTNPTKGVMTKDGKIVHSRFDKFRQINRFLEFIEDILPKLEKDREITILDFGCGKSYLTFAMYYYLHVLKEYDIRIIGLDLKSDVIHHCNELSRKYGYDKLEFLVGDIADYEGVREVDMVVTLHACDTATDFALAKAVGWNAKVILSVPCCQHELNGQMQREGAGYDKLASILDYGLLKERFAALLTDGLRAKYLEQSGYETQVLEFIDMEHTPKNILLRAVKTNQAKQGSESQIQACKEFLGIQPMLGLLLDKGTES